MSHQKAIGPTPFDRLRGHFEATERKCPACGREGGGEWRAETDGGRVRYEHVCPTCGTVHDRTYTMR